MKIGSTTVEAGQSEVVKLLVGQLPSGNSIYITAHVHRAKEQGPVMLLLGGMHGDEINGIEIVREFVTNPPVLKTGTVIAIPLLNSYGFINFSREVPDGKDVNRSFPGSKSGSLASRVAHALFTEVLPHVHFVVDLHTGGRGNYNYPQIRYTPGHADAEAMAVAFGAPVRLAYPVIAKSLRKSAADKRGIPVLVFEGGENLRYDGLSIQHALAGIRRLLSFKGMIDAPFEQVTGHFFNHSTWIRANRGGLFQWMKPSGNWVVKGEPLGFINDPQSLKPIKYIHATASGYLIGHNNTPVVSQGDALFHLAFRK
ncbi:MAG: succinylglutamate desuccinylase/aspartoacylase family protein [Saprospiraceae bacterium]